MSSEEIELSSGATVKVSEFVLEDLSEARKWVDAIKGQVDWAGLDKLDAASAVMLLASKFPSVAAKIIAYITGQSASAVKGWPMVDVLRVLNAWLTVNHFEEMVREGSDFFGRLATLLGSVQPAENDSDGSNNEEDDSEESENGESNNEEKNNDGTKT